MSNAVVDAAVDSDLAELSARVARRRDKAADLQPTKSRKMFTGAESVADSYAQGDVDVVVIQEAPLNYLVGSAFKVDPALIPADYEEVAVFSADHARLSGMSDTIGNRHILQSFAGVRMWRAKVYDSESLDGPILAFAQRVDADHPTHGAISFAPGQVYAIRYPREYNAAMKAIVKARD